MLAQTAVAEKASEIVALPMVLDALDITDAVITADALHVQRGHADYLHQRGAHYLLPVEANQPTLLRRLRALPWTTIGVGARERCRGHGRLETRSIAVVSLDPQPDFGDGEFFRHAAQAVRIVRRRQIPARTVEDHHHLPDHLADRVPGRPGAAGPLDPPPLAHRSPALGPFSGVARGVA